MDKKNHHTTDNQNDIHTENDKADIGVIGMLIGLLPLGFACGGAMSLDYFFKQYQQGDISIQFFGVLLLLVVPFTIMAVLLAIKCFSIKNSAFQMVDGDIVFEGKLLPTWAVVYYRLLMVPLSLFMCLEGIKTVHLGFLSTGITLLLWSFYTFFIKKGVDVVSVSSLFRNFTGK